MKSADLVREEESIELVFARERAHIGVGAVEAVARVRAVVRTAEHNHVWRSAGVATLEQTLDIWPRESFPQLLDALAARHPGVRPKVALTADHFSWFARRAPRTFERLIRETELLQRDPCFALARDSDGVRFAWRPAGPVHVEPRPAPLFELAHALARGQVLGASGAGDDARQLVRATIVAHWIHGRLPAELEWLPASRSLRLRGSERALFLREGAAHGSRGLVLEGDGSIAPVALDLTPPIDTPTAVVRAALTWLLESDSTLETELFLDPTAEHVRSSA